MAVLSALRRTPSALARNPVLFVPALLLSVAQVPQLLLQSTAPLVASLLSLVASLALVVVTPFVQAGLVGMADEALDGRTSLSTFVAEGREHFVSVFGAYLVVVGVNLLLGTVIFVGVAIGVVGVAAGGGLSSVSTPMLVAAGLVAAAVALAYLLFAFAVQFYGQAVVLDGYDAVGSIKHSVGVVRRNLASTLGYSLVVAVLSGVFGGAVALGSVASAPEAAAVPLGAALPSVGAVAVAALVVVAGTLFGGFFGTFSVAFYRELTR